MSVSRKRERSDDDFLPFQITFDECKRPTIVQPLAITAQALVDNHQRLTSYVNNMPQEYLIAMLDVIASGCNLTPMVQLLQHDNFFWYLVIQRRMREGYYAKVDYKKMVFMNYCL